jgi:hypothetical protein
VNFIEHSLSSDNPADPNGHNVAVSRVGNKLYLNNDNNDVVETTHEYVMRFVSVIAFVT